MMKEHVTENVQKATQMFVFQMKQSMIPSATNQKIINEIGVLIDKIVPGIEQMEAPMLNDIADHKFPADEVLKAFLQYWNCVRSHSEHFSYIPPIYNQSMWRLPGFLWNPRR